MIVDIIEELMDDMNLDFEAIDSSKKLFLAIDSANIKELIQ